jgi:hypothetical protein
MKQNTDNLEYTKEVEDLFIDMMLNDPELFVRCKGILSSRYFEDRANIRAVNFITKHYDEFSGLPSREQIFAVADKKISQLDEIHSSHKDWFLSEFETFCRHRALEEEILNSTPLLEEKRYGEVEDRIKKAVQIGLVKDLGTDYFADPQARLEDVKNSDDMTSTGWRDIDKKLYGGFTKGALNIFAGQCVTGDTTVTAVKVQNLDKYFSQSGQQKD